MSNSDTTSDIDATAGGGSVTRRQCDWDDIEPSTAIAGLLTEATDRDVRDLDPLYHTIDSDALDALMQSQAGRADCTVSFSYDGFAITVRGDGEVTLSGPAIDPTL